MPRIRPYSFKLLFSERVTPWYQQEEYFLNEKYGEGYRLVAVVYVEYARHHRYYFEKEVQ